MRIRILAVACLLVLSVSASTYGQQSLRAKIPIAFTVSGKLLQPGEYTFVPSSDERSITVTSPDKSSALARVLTRLAAGIHTTRQDSHVVFDKIGDKFFLSEIWIAGQDGFSLLNTEEKHEHRIIDIPVSK